jgi:uncharacterized protein YqeY
MSLIQELDTRFKDAMKSKDAAALKTLRMVRARLHEHARQRRVAERELSDAEVRQIVSAYVKQLRKSIPEFEKGGATAQAAIAEIRAEIAFLEPYLPQLLDEAATRALVAETVAEMGRPPRQRSGMVIGRIMKAHAAEVDPALVRRLVEESLGE